MRKAHMVMLATSTGLLVVLMSSAGAQDRSIPETGTTPFDRGGRGRPVQSMPKEPTRLVPAATGVQPQALIASMEQTTRRQGAPQAQREVAPNMQRGNTVPPRMVSTPVVPEGIITAAVPLDLPVAEKLQQLIANKTKVERMIPRKNERDAIVAHYTGTKYAPLWVDRGMESVRAKAAREHLQGIGADGLDPADYPMPSLEATTSEAAAEAELRFTATLLTYARHATSGRLHFSRVSPNIEYKESFEPGEALGRIAGSPDLARTLAELNPPHSGYDALKAKLAELRNKAEDTSSARLPDGPVLRFIRDRGGHEMAVVDPRVPQLRERLGLPPESNSQYNRTLADAVAKFQKSQGLKVDGQLNAATAAALNPMSRDKQIHTVLLNLERWRWMPRDLGRTHVMLNIPDYHLQVISDGAQVWKTRVVVGKPSQATPLLTETMKFITINPTWNVPQSIIYNELLPIYETSDRSVFDKMGLRVERRPNGEIRVYQPPSERNALGRFRFNFPNKFLVFQHDTPEKHYFAHDRRAYSHGCIRVQDPLKYAEVLLSFAVPRSQITQDTLRRMYGNEERQIDFKQLIPVHTTYQTAFVDEAGKLRFREDIYRLDENQAKLMDGEERKVADVPLARPADPNFKPTNQDRQRLHSAARSTNGDHLFWLFGR